MTWIDPAWAMRCGWTLIHFLWQGTALAGTLGLTLWLSKGCSSRLRYGLACLALAGMAVAPVVTWFQLGKPLGARPGSVSSQVESTTEWRILAPMGRIFPANKTVPSNHRWEGKLPLGVELWLLGVAVMSLRLSSGWIWLQWIRRRPETVAASDDIQLRLLRLCQRMNLASNIRILLCEKVPGPTVMGWLRPVILLPPAALMGMPADQLELVLVHELAHILRHDFAINLIQSCVEVLLFYHPAVWWVSAKIRQERELCCDDLAVRTTGDALDYAAALTRLEALCRPPDPPRHTAQALALSATGGSFMHRIRRLISPTSSTPLAPRAGLVLLLLMGMSFALHAARPAQDAPPKEAFMLLRRFNEPSPDGLAKAGDVSLLARELSPVLGLTALDQLAALPVKGPVTELRLPISPGGDAVQSDSNFNFPAVDPAFLRLVFQDLIREQPLTQESCPPHGVIIRRRNAGTQRLSPIPELARLSVVAMDADIDLIKAALAEIDAMKPTPNLHQRVTKVGEGPVAKGRTLTFSLTDAEPSDLRIILDDELTRQMTTK